MGGVGWGGVGYEGWQTADVRLADCRYEAHGRIPAANIYPRPVLSTPRCKPSPSSFSLTPLTPASPPPEP
eukprot:354105-Chlamydomonas_euryale.AAC.2